MNRWILALLASVSVVFAADELAEPLDENESAPAPQPKNEMMLQPLPQPTLVKTSQRKWSVARWAGIGYRYDHQTFKDYTSSDALNTKMTFRKRNTIQVLAGMGFNWYGAVLTFRGGYGWMTKGYTDFNAPGNNGGFPLAFDPFKIGAGYTADAQGSLGYRIPVIGTEPFAMKITPSIGYKYSHIMNYPKGQQQANISTIGITLAQFTAPSQQDWFGPYFEAKIETRFYKHIFCSLFYQYALPTMRMVTYLQENFYQIPTPGSLNLVQLVNEKDVVHGHALRTQLGGVDLSHQDNSGWRIGLHFEGSVTWSDTSRVYLQRKIWQYIQSPAGPSSTFAKDRMAIVWKEYMAYLHAGYRF
ncbi:MAG: hypothetical protein JSS32_08510 [Verrucomicrobia bacterium]|nr:hypothetical protein [Verrucomicrobiota bacterium]